jgi:FkbM family methyltransferase
MARQADNADDFLISYAQHGEDVMLYRALKQVKRGFYIDVGAHDPEHFSVTKAFYDRGWFGINVEPEGGCFQGLVEARTRDVNLRVLVGEEEGSAEFFEVKGTGLSTLDAKLASEHADKGHEVSKVVLARRTLDSICEDANPGEIHFLKIDVEGAEESVLRGASLTKYRPWIIVAESTKPLSAERCDDFITEYLASHGYKHVYFDGVNSFYLADEHGDLLRFFDRPPNPFDHFTTPAQLELALRNWELGSMRNSWSWKLTAPLRACHEAVNRLLRR